jgi:pantoate--beta-alanine ligase
MAEEGERDAKKIVAAMTELIETEPAAHIDYVKVVDGLTMQPVDKIEGPIVTAIAVYINDTARLIDNFHFSPEMQ